METLHPTSQQKIETIKYFCPFLRKGFCREADTGKCKFSHESQSSLKIPDAYCFFYLANQCLYGNECKFLHNEPSELPPQEPTSSSSSSTEEKPLDHPPKSYARVCRGNTVSEETSLKDLPLCEYAMEGECPNSVGQCVYLHGLVCDLCERSCLHPYNIDQQRQHREDCIKHHEEDMEESFNIQRSIDKICGICMEKVMEKQPVTARRFGILEKCVHIFCLDCIRTWRGTKHFESRTIRACPECRICSDFVVPSKYWVEDKEDKDKLISGYKENLSLKPCKYFNQGRGQCPFAASCFYKHAYPDGRPAEMDPPRPRRKINAQGRVSAVAVNYILWNILEGADEEWLYDEWSLREGNDSSDDESLW